MSTLTAEKAAAPPPRIASAPDPGSATTRRPAEAEERRFRRLALTGALLYLIVIVGGAFSEFFVRQGLVVSGDAAATAANIEANRSLFEVGMVADLIAHTSYFLLAVVMYLLLRHVSRAVSMLFVLLVTTSAAILSLNMVNQFAAWQLLSGAGYLSAFTTEQLQAAALFFLELHGTGYLVAQITFGGWLIPLGYVVYRSGHFPRVIGGLLVAGGVAYVADALLSLLFLESGYSSTAAGIVLTVPVVAELSLFAWLLVLAFRGKPRDRLEAPAPLAG